MNAKEMPVTKKERERLKSTDKKTEIFYIQNGEGWLDIRGLLNSLCKKTK